MAGGETTKRAAFESPARLARPAQASSTMRRPTATAMGSVLVVLRVLGGILWLVALATQWHEVVRAEPALGEADVATLDVVLAVILAFGALVLLVELAFAFLVWRGGNRARIVVMVFATLSITLSAVQYFTGQEEITIRTTFLILALDILVLLALSSRKARTWAQRRQAARASARVSASRRRVTSSSSV